MGKINDNDYIDNIKSLAYDMLEKNHNKEYESITLSSATLLYTLIKNHLIFDVDKPFWANRDRLVITDNRLTALYYSVNYYLNDTFKFGDIKEYNKLSGNTPSSFIYNIDTKVETTSDNMSISTAIGMAMAGKYLEETYSTKKSSLFAYDIFVLATDDTILNSGNISASMLAGKYNLDNIIIIYNHEKDTEIKDMAINNYSSNGFKIIEIKNKDNIKELDKNIDSAKNNDGPVLLVIDSSKYTDDINEIKSYLGYTTPFCINEKLVELGRNTLKERLSSEYKQWFNDYKNYINTLNEKDKTSLVNYLNEEDINLKLDKIINAEKIPLDKPMNYINYQIINILSGLNNTFINASSNFKLTECFIKNKGIYSCDNYTGKNIEFKYNYDVMGSIMNGYALTGLRPIVSSTLSNLETMISSIRSSAMMNLPIIYIFTHDTFMGYENSIEAPVEHIGILRSIPNLEVYRPCDYKELMGCYNHILESSKPSVILVSNKTTDTFKYTSAEETANGGYVISEVKNRLDLVLLSSGSEVGIAMRIKKELLKNYIEARVVSVPNLNVFNNMDLEYLSTVIPKGYKTIALEYSSDNTWYKIVNKNDFININSYIKNGSIEEVLEYHEIDIKNIIMKIKNNL